MHCGSMHGVRVTGWRHATPIGWLHGSLSFFIHLSSLLVVLLVHVTWALSRPIVLAHAILTLVTTTVVVVPAVH